MVSFLNPSNGIHNIISRSLMQDRNPHLDAIIEKIKNIKPEELAQETKESIILSLNDLRDNPRNYDIIRNFQTEDIQKIINRFQLDIISKNDLKDSLDILLRYRKESLGFLGRLKTEFQDLMEGPSKEYLSLLYSINSIPTLLNKEVQKGSLIKIRTDLSKLEKLDDLTDKLNEQIENLILISESEFILQIHTNHIQNIFFSYFDSKIGLLAKIQIYIDKLIYQEKLSAPSDLKIVFSELLLLSENSDSAKKEVLSKLVFDTSEKYSNLLLDQEKQFLILFAEDLMKDRTLNLTQKQQAQELILNLMSKMQGSSLQIFDQLKSQLADPKTGLASQTISSIIMSLKKELTQDAPFLIKKLHSAAIRYTNRDLPFNALLTVQQEVLNDSRCHIELSEVELSHIASLQDEIHFELWWEDFQKLKETRQGFLPLISDTTQKNISIALSPLKSFFSDCGLVSNQNDIKSKDSLFTKLLSSVKSQGNKSVKILCIYLLKQTYKWIEHSQFKGKKEEEKIQIDQLFQSILQKVENTNFSNSEERSQLVEFLRLQLSPYQIMIDKVIALPNFYRLTNNELLEKLKLSLDKLDQQNHNHIKEWSDSFLKSELSEEILFNQNDFFGSEEDKITFKMLLQKIIGEDLSAIENLKTFINSKFVFREDRSIDYLGKAIDNLNEKKFEKEISTESTDELKHQLSQTCSFLVVYKICCKLMGINISEIKNQNDQIIKNLHHLTREEKHSAYLQQTQQISLDEFRLKSFASIMEKISSSEDKKQEFILQMKRIFKETSNNSLKKHLISSLLPYLLMVVQYIIEHNLTIVINLFKKTTFKVPVTINQSLNTEFIRQITGYLNKIDSTFRHIPGTNNSSSITDHLKHQLKQKINVNEDFQSIEDLFSKLNFSFVQNFIPDISISKYFSLMSELVIDNLKKTQNTSTYFIKSIICYPILGILKSFQYLLLIPTEKSIGFLARRSIYHVMNFSHITQKLTDKIFKEFQSTTGIYHVIKKPLVSIMEELNHKNLFDSSSSSVDTSILSQQDDAKRDLGEMYTSLKIAASWLKNAKNMESVRSINQNGGPSAKSFLEQTIQKVEEEFFAETLAEKLLEAYHRITQPKFLDESIRKTLKSVNKSLQTFGHIESLEDIEQNVLENKNCDAKIKVLSNEFLSNIFDQILKHALSELGTKQKKSIDQFFDYIETQVALDNYFDKENFDKLELEKKISYLENLKTDFLRKSIELKNKKVSLAETLSQSDSLQHMYSKTIHLEKIMSNTSEILNELIQNYKLTLEIEKFSPLLNEINKYSSLNNYFHELKSSIDNDESSEEELEEIKNKIVTFLAFTQKLKPYSLIENGITTEISKVLSEFKTTCEIFYNDTNNLYKLYDEYYRKKVLLGFLEKSQKNILDSMFKDQTLLASFKKDFKENLQKIDESTLPSKLNLEQLKFFSSDTVEEATSYYKSLTELISKSIATTTDKIKNFNIKSLQLPENQLDSDQKLEYYSSLEDHFMEIKKSVKAIKKLKHIDIELIEQTPLFNWSKNLVLQQVKKESSKFKEFLNSKEIIETFFYNCILPSLIK